MPASNEAARKLAAMVIPADGEPVKAHDEGNVTTSDDPDAYWFWPERLPTEPEPRNIPPAEEIRAICFKMFGTVLVSCSVVSKIKL